MRWFDASPRRATPKGHDLHHLHSTTSGSPTYIRLPSALVAHPRSRSPGSSPPGSLLGFSLLHDRFGVLELVLPGLDIHPALLDRSREPRAGVGQLVAGPAELLDRTRVPLRPVILRFRDLRRVDLVQPILEEVPHRVHKVSNKHLAEWCRHVVRH